MATKWYCQCDRCKVEKFIDHPPLPGGWTRFQIEHVELNGTHEHATFDLCVTCSTAVLDAIHGIGKVGS